MRRQNSLESFLRILRSNGNSDTNQWIERTNNALRNNERLCIQFLKLTGLRMSEGLAAFNLIIQLTKEGKLGEYLDKELSCLMHFKYPKQFIRGTKNVFISFVKEPTIREIADSETVTYDQIRKRLQRNRITIRINELRDNYGTYLLHHGMLEQEVNLLQGRIPVSVFVRHYWSPKLAELRDRVFKALEELK